MIFRVYLTSGNCTDTSERGCTLVSYTRSPRTIAFVFSPSRFRFPLLLPFRLPPFFPSRSHFFYPHSVSPFSIFFYFFFFFLSLPRRQFSAPLPPPPLSASIFLRPLLSALLIFLFLFSFPLPTLPTSPFLFDFASLFSLFLSPSLQLYFHPSSASASFVLSTLFLIISFSLCLYSPPLHSLSLSLSLLFFSLYSPHCPFCRRDPPPFSLSLSLFISPFSQPRGLSLSFVRHVASQRDGSAQNSRAFAHFRVGRASQKIRKFHPLASVTALAFTVGRFLRIHSRSFSLSLAFSFCLAT